mmetsp:Transcript_38290/g.88846  ORF Transcript_38290/g.88846 Transcript_38290/m.88846 type:complete len:204 (+) Transcript_38290:855-1466(+)
MRLEAECNHFAWSASTNPGNFAAWHLLLLGLVCEVLRLPRQVRRPLLQQVRLQPRLLQHLGLLLPGCDVRRLQPHTLAGLVEQWYVLIIDRPCSIVPEPAVPPPCLLLLEQDLQKLLHPLHLCFGDDHQVLPADDNAFVRLPLVPLKSSLHVCGLQTELCVPILRCLHSFGDLNSQGGVERDRKAMTSETERYHFLWSKVNPG